MTSVKALKKIKRMIKNTTALLITSSMGEYDIALSAELGVPLFGSSAYESRVQTNRTFMKRFLVEAGLPVLPSLSVSANSMEAEEIRSFICKNNSYPRFDVISEDTSPYDMDLVSKPSIISWFDGILVFSQNIGDDIRSSGRPVEEDNVNIKDEILDSLERIGFPDSRQMGLPDKKCRSISIECVPCLTGDSLDCVHIAMMVGPDGEFTINGTVEQVLDMSFGNVGCLMPSHSMSQSVLQSPSQVVAGSPAVALGSSIRGT
jgi:hypothetical protein